jgi:hypothetical protein
LDGEGEGSLEGGLFGRGSPKDGTEESAFSKTLCALFPSRPMNRRCCRVSCCSHTIAAVKAGIQSASYAIAAELCFQPMQLLRSSCFLPSPRPRYRLPSLPRQDKEHGGEGSREGRLFGKEEEAGSLEGGLVGEKELRSLHLVSHLQAQKGIEWPQAEA